MASFIDDIIGKIFPNKKSPIKHRENFTQSHDAEEYTRQWLGSEEGKFLMDLVQKNYHFKTSGMNAAPEVHILNSPYANGFAVSYESPFDPKSFSQLFFAFGQRMLDLGYQKISLDRKIEEINDDVKTTEKQYFKPPMGSVDISKRIDQLYGNVSVEKVSVNEKPSFLKILVTVYSDHLYSKARPFEQFIEDIFEN
ncbi:hypothetical protein ACFSKL_00915 [Belliella marina]|uniref:Uncharacterized protein n=1 Tax=Belliella marina TaxID=1644146 RepID=A0ABW4VI37_9BACT